MPPKISRQEEYHEIIGSYRSITDLARNPFISAENLTKDFEIGKYIVRAVSNVSFQVAQHEYIAIIGASGAGKTTLLHLLAGLDRPNEGIVRVSFIDITPMEEETLTTFRIFNIGVIFQNYNLISSFTALENIMFPLQLCGVALDECEKRGLELLEKIGLDTRADHLPFQLSAGEQQRVAIGRSLANDPPIIIADEPTANLDKKNAEFIGSLFEELRSEGKTILVATHDEKLIKHAHRILEMEEGKIISDTRVRSVEYRDSPESQITEG